MKKSIKLLTACLTAVLLFAASCVPAFADESLPEESLMEYASGLLSELTSLDDENLDSVISTYESYGYTAVAQGLSEWKSLKTETGDYIGINSSSVSLSEDGSYLITLEMNCSNEACDVTITVGSDGYLSGLSFAEKATLGSKMKDASVNLVVGMGTVFLVLVFLCWVISLFKYVGRFEQKLTGKKKAAPAPAAPVRPAPAPAAAAAEAASEEELRAVIAAAVAAYEADTGASANRQPSLNNGLIIKTYRRN